MVGDGGVTSLSAESFLDGMTGGRVADALVASGRPVLGGTADSIDWLETPDCFLLRIDWNLNTATAAISSATRVAVTRIEREKAKLATRTSLFSKAAGDLTCDRLSPAGW